MTYYKLLEGKDAGDIIMKDSVGKFYVYSFGAEKWVRSAIMLRYQWAEDDLYDQYTEVSENDALFNLDTQRINLLQLFSKAKKIAYKAHHGQIDKGENPYIEHPLAVAESLEDLEQKIIALLHDVLEDSQITAEFLLEQGFTKRIISSIITLSKKDGQNYDEYLKFIKQDNLAWKVKMADIRHNMDISRISAPTSEDTQRIKKYKKALAFLEL